MMKIKADPDWREQLAFRQLLVEQAARLDKNCDRRSAIKATKKKNRKKMSILSRRKNR